MCARARACVCVHVLMWSVPAYVDIGLDLASNYHIPLQFSSFPNACYKCRKIGHFACQCSQDVNSFQPSPYLPAAGSLDKQGLQTVLDESGYNT